MGRNTGFLWHPPKIWAGSTAYIIGGGPSVKQQDLSLIHDKHVIGVNNSYTLGDWVDVCWWGDMGWLMWHRKRLLKRYHGLVATCNQNSNVIQKNKHWIKFFRRGKQMGVDDTSGSVAWNKNSGCSAINLAWHFGVKRVVLLGFDMKVGPEGETHWHNGHKKKPVSDPAATYNRFRKTTTFIFKDAKKLGLEILNASPVTTITVFPIVKLEDVV